MVATRFHWAALIVLIAPSWLSAQTSLPFSMPPGATETFVSGNAGDPLNTGFARILASPGSVAPEAFSILQFRNNGTLISEATVPSSPLTTGKRVFVEVSGGVNTGIAIANSNSQEVTIGFGFQDPAARVRFGEVNEGTFTIPPNSQFSAFINEAPFNMPAPYVGLMSVGSSIPVAITVLRGLTNERSEFLMTPVQEGLPAPDAFGPVRSQPRITAGFIPRFADGGGWSTEIVLINKNSSEFGFVTLEFIGPTGNPIAVTIDGQTATTFPVFLERRDFTRITTSGEGPETRAGYIRVIGDQFSAEFGGFALYSFKDSDSGVTVSTASLPMVQPGKSFRLFIDQSESPEQLQTGVAIGNTSSAASVVFLELTDLEGNSTGLTSAVQIPAFGQFGMFFNEIPGFTAVPFPFRGVLRLTTTSSEGITVAGFRGHVNERSDFVMASLLPSVPGDETVVVVERVVPQIVQGSGYTTEVVLLNDQPGAANGVISSVSSNGAALSLLATSPQ